MPPAGVAVKGAGMHNPQKAQEEIIDDFGLFDNWLDRYQANITKKEPTMTKITLALVARATLAPGLVFAGDFSTQQDQ